MHSRMPGTIPIFSKSWRPHRETPQFLRLSAGYRSIIYTRNEIEFLNSVIRVAIKKRKVF
jgi:putative transposase